MFPERMQVAIFFQSWAFLLVPAIVSAFPVPAPPTSGRAIPSHPGYPLWPGYWKMQENQPMSYPVLLLQREEAINHPVPYVYVMPQHKGMIYPEVSKRYPEMTGIKYRLFYNSLGDLIESSSFFPIEFNVPDMISTMWGYMMSLPILNRWQQQQQQQQQQQAPTTPQSKLKLPGLNNIDIQTSYIPMYFYP